MTRNFRPSLACFLKRPMRIKKKKKKKKKKTVTRNFQLSHLRKSDQACFIFLVTFWNYPARSKDQVKKLKTKTKSHFFSFRFCFFILPYFFTTRRIVLKSDKKYPASLVWVWKSFFSWEWNFRKVSPVLNSHDQ